MFRYFSYLDCHCRVLYLQREVLRLLQGHNWMFGLSWKLIERGTLPLPLEQRLQGLHVPERLSMLLPDEWSLEDSGST